VWDLSSSKVSCSLAGLFFFSYLCIGTRRSTVQILLIKIFLCKFTFKFSRQLPWQATPRRRRVLVSLLYWCLYSPENFPLKALARNLFVHVDKYVQVNFGCLQLEDEVINSNVSLLSKRMKEYLIDNSLCLVVQVESVYILTYLVDLLVGCRSNF